MSPADALNRDLESQAPAVWAALSPLGRRAFYPKDITYQAAEARGKTYNGTIGVYTDGHGHAVPVPAMARAVQLDRADLDRAFLYSPVPGLPEARELWRKWQRHGVDEAVPSTLPLVTAGLAHGLAIVADLFGGPGRAVAVGEPFWGNYTQIFEIRTDAVIKRAPGYRDGRYNTRVLAEALADVPPGKPAVGILNFPSNPGGYSPNVEERAELRQSLLEIADQRPFVIVLDDAYAGLAYEDDTPQASLFWELACAHEQLIPVKIDGATKEFFFFGGRVGFITFGLAPDSRAAEVLESKMKGLLRSTIGSPGATSQMILLQALRDPDIRQQVEEIRRGGRERYDVLKPLLAELDRRYLRPLPFNAGFFALLELPVELGVSSEEVRRHLLEHYDTGVISIGERYVRLAICSVAPEAIPEMVRRVEAGVRELADKRNPT